MWLCTLVLLWIYIHIGRRRFRCVQLRCLHFNRQLALTRYLSSDHVGVQPSCTFSSLTKYGGPGLVFPLSSPYTYSSPSFSPALPFKGKISLFRTFVHLSPRAAFHHTGHTHPEQLLVRRIAGVVVLEKLDAAVVRCGINTGSKCSTRHFEQDERERTPSDRAVLDTDGNILRFCAEAVLKSRVVWAKIWSGSAPAAKRRNERTAKWMRLCETQSEH